MGCETTGLLIQEEYVGVKCMWNRGWASSHLVTVGLLWVA